MSSKKAWYLIKWSTNLESHDCLHPEVYMCEIYIYINKCVLNILLGNEDIKQKMIMLKKSLKKKIKHNWLYYHNGFLSVLAMNYCGIFWLKPMKRLMPNKPRFCFCWTVKTFYQNKLIIITSINLDWSKLSLIPAWELSKQLKSDLLLLLIFCLYIHCHKQTHTIETMNFNVVCL